MTRIAVVLVQSFADWECAHLMSAARAYFGLDVVVTTPGGTQVRSSGGLLVTPDADTFALDPAPAATPSSYAAAKSGARTLRPISARSCSASPRQDG